MTTQASTKVRLVRCPKCGQVLAELPEFSLYKCGGCGTVLQAKNRKLEANGTALSSQDTDSTAKSRQEDVLKASSSNKDFASQAEVESLSDKDNMRHQGENVDSVELHEDTSVSNGLSSSPEITCEDSSPETNDFSKHDSLGQNSKRHHSKISDDNFSDELPSSGEFTLEAEVYTPETCERAEKSKKDQMEGENSEYKESVLSPENDESSRDFHGEIRPPGLNSSPKTIPHEKNGLPIIRTSRAEKDTRASIDDSIISPQSPSKESLVSFYLTSPDNDRFPRKDSRDFGRISSLDTLGSLAPPVNDYPKSESYYGYDGSESSYDGTDDQIRTANGFRGNNMVNNELESTYWTANSSHFATESTHSSQSKLNESYRYTSGSKMRFDEQEGFSRLPFTSRNPLVGHRKVGLSTNYRLPPRPIFKPLYTEPDKIELLRTVCELKDQLDRMHFPEVMPKRRFSSEDNKFAPFFDERLAPEWEIYGDVGPRGYNLMHNQAKGCAERCNRSRLAFSGEAANYRNRVSCSCPHCCPHYSAQLPPQVNNGRCGVHTDISNSSSPLHYTSSEYSSWTHEDEIKRARLKEKYFAAKRHHLRPVAGGAPLVTCYHCSELLHLPADFLMFGKKYHRLMCDACKKVLRFSVLKGTHLVPYVPGASAPPPPPSEADEYNDTKPLSHARTFQNVEPVSCSDDNGPSFCRSVSTEGEYYNGRKMSSGSSYEDRKMKSIVAEPRNTNGESVGPMTKTSQWRKSSSEIEEASSSPLHRLMGYSSPSQVLDK